MANGLSRGTFVPPPAIQEIRDVTRTRKQLVRQIAQHTLRLQKTLEDANIKIAGVISDLMEMSVRAVLRGLIAGETVLVQAAWAAVRNREGYPHA